MGVDMHFRFCRTSFEDFQSRLGIAWHLERVVSMPFPREQHMSPLHSTEDTRLDSRLFGSEDGDLGLPRQ